MQQMGHTSISRLKSSLALAAFLFAATAGLSSQQAWAQAAPGAPVVQQNVQINWMDAGILAALSGGALFAVCRGSNRM